MEPPPAPAASSSSTPAAPGFQAASSLPRTTHVPSAAANRNASGGLPPVKPVNTAEPEPEPEASTSTAPVKPVNRPAASKNAIIYSVLQRRNPVLPLIRNVGMEIGDIVVDYQVGAHNGVLFLSLKYHRLHPEYIHSRIEKMRQMYNLRILLVLCDINEHQQSLRELTKVCVVNGLTLLVAWSNEEAAQYLTTLKAYEHKSADSLKERIHQTYSSQLEHVLTSGRKVNKSNAEAIAAEFGSFANIAKQSNHSLNAVKGLGKVKIVSLLDAFNKPFMAGGSGKKSAPGQQTAGAGLAPAGTNVTVPSTPGASAPPEPQDDVVIVVDPSPPLEPALAESPVAKDATDLEEAPMPDDLVDDHPPATPPTPKRPEETGPTRSPSVEADPERTATDAVWHDPLEDDDDGEDAGRAVKRARV